MSTTYKQYPYITHHVLGNDSDGKSWLLASSAIKHHARIYKRELKKINKWSNVRIEKEVKTVIIEHDGIIRYA